VTTRRILGKSVAADDAVVAAQGSPG
jgi:hypothetical protein